MLPHHPTSGTMAALLWPLQHAAPAGCGVCSRRAVGTKGGTDSGPTNLSCFTSQHYSYIPIMQGLHETPQGTVVSSNHWACVQRLIPTFKDPCWQQDFCRLRVKEPICRKLLCSSYTVITLTAPQSSLTNTSKFNTCFKTMKEYL